MISLGRILICLSALQLGLIVVVIVVEVIRSQSAGPYTYSDSDSIALIGGEAFFMLVVGCIIYGLGRIVEELVRIRGLLKVNRAPRASEIADQLAEKLRQLRE